MDAEIISYYYSQKSKCDSTFQQIRRAILGGKKKSISLVVTQFPVITGLSSL